jgi:GTP-binding protein Era
VRFIDASRSYGSEERTIEDFLEKTNKPVITVLSKVDSIRQEYASTPADAKISIFDKQGYSDLIGKIQSLLPEGPQLYEEDQYTDQDYETRISEIVREKVFDHLKEELPYAVFVEVEEIEDSPTLMRILATLYVERDSQKSILIGAAGAMITRIGTEARTELERIFDRKMFLKLRVKTLPKWRKNEQQVKKALGNERLIS